MSDETNPNYRGWSILELLGHRVLAGLVQYAPPECPSMYRIDCYDGEATEPYQTQYYSAAALYCLTPTTEAVARARGAAMRPRPAAIHDALPAPARERDDDDFDPTVDYGDDGPDGFDDDDDPY